MTKPRSAPPRQSPVAMYDASVPVFVEKLGDIRHIALKAAQWADERQLDPARIAEARIYPDMHPLGWQAGTIARLPLMVTAALVGAEPPSDPPPEIEGQNPFEVYGSWMTTAIAEISQYSPRRFVNAENKIFEFRVNGVRCTFRGQAFLYRFGLPNFFFHATMFYAILRHIGLPLGKGDLVLRDFTGKAQHFE